MRSVLFTVAFGATAAVIQRRTGLLSPIEKGGRSSAAIGQPSRFLQSILSSLARSPNLRLFLTKKTVHTLDNWLAQKGEAPAAEAVLDEAIHTLLTLSGVFPFSQTEDTHDTVLRILEDAAYSPPKSRAYLTQPTLVIASQRPMNGCQSHTLSQAYMALALASVEAFKLPHSMCTQSDLGAQRRSAQRFQHARQTVYDVATSLVHSGAVH